MREKRVAKILIAEDDDDIRELIEITLTYYGFNVLSVADGEAAVQAAQANRFDLILLDVRMPFMTGYEACAQLKANPVTRATPVIFLSAKGQEDEISAGLRAGAERFILKPFEPEKLVQELHNVLASQPKNTAT